MYPSSQKHLSRVSTASSSITALMALASSLAICRVTENVTHRKTDLGLDIPHRKIYLGHDL
ncbi:hypothetical protein PR002_g31396 [Phytophthora rubi]|uniref:Uncharacterized protein n=1 Tax=Phytophthora rubi TaxID=129364 RepID=A0A6A3GJV5_9STRA|nr:hypothetical protein PR002_g31396 [Phytophthora rubi]